MCILTYICMYVCMYVCMYQYIHICTYLCRYVYIYIQISLYRYAYQLRHPHIYIYVHTYSHTYPCISAYKYTHRPETNLEISSYRSLTTRGLGRFKRRHVNRQADRHAAGHIVTAPPPPLSKPLNPKPQILNRTLHPEPLNYIEAQPLNPKPQTLNHKP